MSPRRILAVTHEASRTGAPIVFAQFLHWLHDHIDVEIHTVIVRDGPLRPQHEALGPVTVLDSGPGSTVLEVAERGLLHLGSRRAWKLPEALRFGPPLRRLGSFDLIYLNSLTSLQLLPYLPAGEVVAHIHELEVAVRAWPLRGAFAGYERRPDRWIAVGEPTRHVLETDLAVSAGQISVHHPFIDVAAIRGPAEDVRRSSELRLGAGIPAAASIVMGCGTTDWRKGPDLFVQLAVEVRRRAPELPVHFVWVGGPLAGPDWLRLQVDIHHSGADAVHFVGATADPLPWFRTADVFALTSREDPFPLVCLEHAALGHPVVAYDSSGITDLLRAAGPTAAAGAIAYLDVGGMAERVVSLLRSTAVRERAAAELSARVAAHHDLAVASHRLAAELGLLDLPS